MMRLTQYSKKLMEFFLKQNCLKGNECLTRPTQNLLKRVYKELDQANETVENLLKREGYNPTIQKITTVSEVPKPKLFNASAFPEEVRLHIDQTSHLCFSYTFSLFGREIKVKFIVEDPNDERLIAKYNDYVKKVLVWFAFIHPYPARQCSKSLTVYVYFTSLSKVLPNSNIHVLEENNVNTAFTYTCRVDSEIVVFRKEEWLKVLMHETMHNFALDFSDMNYKDVDQQIVGLFPVVTRGNSFEAYTEFWAEIMNAVFCSYYMLPNFEKKRENEFVKNFEFFIAFEKVFGIFQMVKALDFMGMQYQDLYDDSPKSQMMRKNLYKEKTNVLSYYVIRVILLTNYQDFLKWCIQNNGTPLIQFKKSPATMAAFFGFVKDHYKKKTLLTSVSQMDKVLANLKKRKATASGKSSSSLVNKKEFDFIANSMRMSICELG
jgi:hypothetical protein